MIDVNDPSLNWVLNICFFLILGLGVLSFVPWKLKSGRNRWTLLLPIFLILVYVVYEFKMPDNWDIRIDLFLLWPVLILSLLMGFVRGVLILRHQLRSR